MTQTLSAENLFLSGFEAFPASLGEPEWLVRLRRASFERFRTLGWPTRRQEQWRHLDLSSLSKLRFTAAGTPTAPDAAKVRAYTLPGSRELVFVDGYFCPTLSHLGDLPTGVVLGSLAEVLREAPQTIKTDLERFSRLDEPFAALNTAYWQDGAFLLLPEGVVIEEPVHLLFLSSSSERPLASYPRVLISAGANSQATVVETYASLGSGSCFTCPVVEATLGAGARIEHYRLLRENFSTYHLADTHIHLDRDASFVTLAFNAGGILVRHDLHADLDAPGADCQLGGLYLSGGNQQIDNHLWMRHQAPHTTSRQIYKGILAGHARAVFNGNIYVAGIAAKTDAKQTNRNLLLSNHALVHTNPQLEIFAGDVRCTHGSTVGQIDPDALFYLRSRGLDVGEARSLLTYAFANDLFESIRLKAIREELERLLFTWLTQTDLTG